MFRYVLFASLAVSALDAVPQLENNIAGGTDTSIEEFPYQISLHYYNTYICGGSIISRDWVLTAAHCVIFDPRFYDITQLIIRAGSTLRDSTGSVHHCKLISSHPSYNEVTFDYDIAVIKVSTPFTFSDVVAPVSLAETRPADGVYAVVAGWGTFSFGGASPAYLVKVVVPILSQSSCSSSYSTLATITDRMICAGNTTFGKDACQGDSGGPLVANNVQVGVVSWGIGCASRLYPGVYASVNSLRSWVKEQTGV